MNNHFQKGVTSGIIAALGTDIFVQNVSVVKDYGVFDDPDTFFEKYPQTWSKVKDLAYVYYGRKKMNRTVGKIRAAAHIR